MAATAVKITRKGQITIPKEIREIINAHEVYFEVQGDTVMIKPVPDAAGSLREYAGNVRTKSSVRQIKERAWEEAIREKIHAKLS